ncbi:MAG: threonine efflux protein [Rhodospirillaceae bacterium]|nr:MAG: threonine efflux protein [Rhodospirillaceae bacterium]
MDLVPNLVGLATMHILMAMLPGPNTVVVGWYSATRSRSDGLKAVAGVVVASLVWVVLAIGGVGALLLEAGWLYRALRFVGAAYLIYVGVRLLRAGFGPKGSSQAAPPQLAGRNPFTAGLMTTLSNPKSAVFWTSAFLVALPPHAPGWVYPTIVAIVAVQSTLWYGTLAVFFSTGVAQKLYQRIAGYLDLLAGGVMIALGLKLADELRREVFVKAAT